MKTFWQTLPRPFYILAPMEDVTDIVFRQMVARCGRPHVFFTEFTSADGLVSKGAQRVADRLLFSPDEKPIVAQIWGNNPKTIEQAARIVSKMGFDGIDINMGCPQRKFVQKGYCAGLIRTPALAKEIFLAASEGAGDLPVSIKTRIGYDKIQTEEWIGFLLELDPAALTIHARTAKEMSLVPAHWDQVGIAVEVRNKKGKTVPIIGNGDVKSLSQARDLAARYHADGIMIGRGIFDNIALFNEQTTEGELVPFPQRLGLLHDHIRLFSETWKEEKPFIVLKKYFKIYISDIPGAHHLRMKLMETQSAEEALKLVERWQKEPPDMLPEKAQAEKTGENQIDGDNIVQEPRKDQDQNPEQ